MSMKDDIKYVEALGFRRTESLCYGSYVTYSRWFNGGSARLTVRDGKWTGVLQAQDFSKDYGPVEASAGSCPAPGLIVGKMLADLDGLGTSVASIKAGLGEKLFFKEAISRSGE